MRKRSSGRARAGSDPLKKKKRIAFFTGAGASKAYGYALTSEILPTILKWIASGKLFEDYGHRGNDRARLKRFIDDVLPGRKRPDASLPLITELLSLVDYSLLNSGAALPGMSRGKLQEMRKLIEVAILDVVWEPLDRKRAKTALLKRLVDVLISIARSSCHELAIVSTNYDMSLDGGIFEKVDGEGGIEGDWDFGFTYRDIPGPLYASQPGSDFHIYKLHGSLNWARCDLCEHIYVNFYEPIATIDNFRKSADNTCHCGHYPLRGTLIAPSFVRDIREPNLLQVWQRSLEWLRTADEWIIAGYSFPSEDVPIRAMFLRALMGRKRPPAITVIQVKDKDDATKRRYHTMLPVTRYLDDGLESFLPELESMV